MFLDGQGSWLPTAECDSARGILLGLALGDALGAQVKFCPRDSFEPLTTLRPGGPFDLDLGEWTDETSQMLCVVDSLLACGGMDTADQVRRLSQFVRYGENTSRGECVEVDAALREAISPEESARRTVGKTCQGGGALSRVAALTVYYRNSLRRDIVRRCVASARLTHRNAEVLDVCRLLTRTLAIIQKTKQRGPAWDFCSDRFLPERHRLATPVVQSLANGSFLGLSYKQLDEGESALGLLTTALWCFAHSEDFEEGALLAANLGGCADSRCSVYGQIAGAYYGASGLPADWLSVLVWGDEIANLADRLTLGKHSSVGQRDLSVAA